MEFIDRCAKTLAEKSNITGEDYEVMRYGLAVIYINLSKTVILLICALLLGVLKETTVLFCSYAAIRSAGFGYHSDNSVKCTIICVGEFITAVLAAIYLVSFKVYVCIALFLLCEVVFLLYAPAETEKRPISDKRKKTFKIAAMVITACMLILSLTLKNNVYRNLITFGVCLEAINVLPIMKKILK